MKKLIEVALPLEAINEASAHEKSVPRRGHPATLHLWWARRPLAACRAVLFASLVDDPSSHPEEFPTAEDQTAERERLFRIIEELVQWENSTNSQVLDRAKDEIRRSVGDRPPPILDPFSGGGSIPLEAQRLGLEVHAADLNPVAVLITKSLVDIAPRFSGRAPINPDTRSKLAAEGAWVGASAIAEDVRSYGAWMREQAEERIGSLYPAASVPGGREATVIAWIWARTVRCPNPACGAEMPLVRSLVLSSKKGKEVWMNPIVDDSDKTVRFEIRNDGDKPPPSPKVGRGGAFRCLVCDQVADDEHTKKEGKAGRMGSRLLAMVAEGNRQRIYLAADAHHEEVAQSAEPDSIPEDVLAHDPRNIWCVNYGLSRHRDLFTNRQLVALTTLCDLVVEVRQRVLKDALDSGMHDDGQGVEVGGEGATAYADSIALYLSFAVSKAADWGSSICTWIHSIQGIRDTFARQAIPMTWDFAELNPLSNSVGNLLNHVEWVADCVATLPVSSPPAHVLQRSAEATACSVPVIVATDPPYYDNISYADLSDFFYVWLRRSIGAVFPNLFSTLETPKSQELIASPHRFDGDKNRAEEFFESGLGRAFVAMRGVQSPNFPLTLFYAFKQAETREDGVASTGWETMLQALLDSGLGIDGTWPIRSERAARTTSVGTNALASSIVLVSRPRKPDAPVATRGEFAAELRAKLPVALKVLQQSNIAPVDLAQASIGPGMAVFSGFAKIVEASGESMRVRSALTLINEVLDEVLSEQEGDFDNPTRFAVAWFETNGFEAAGYGQAEVLAKAKNTSPEALQRDGLLVAKAGRVQLRNWQALSEGWDPASDRNLTIWEATHYLIKAHQDRDSGSEAAAASLLRRLGGFGERARELAYRLFRTCETKGWTDLALSYNALIVAWPEMVRLSTAIESAPEQLTAEGV